MGQIKAIILDFDGVIAESNAVKNSAFGEFFALYPEYSVAMQAYHEAHHAEPRRFKFTYFVEELMGRPGDSAKIDALVDEFSELVAELVIACPEVPGAGVFLETFSQRLPLYISSVTPQEELQHILEARGSAPYIRQAFGNPPHPKNKAIETILDREGLQPNQAAFVGDSESDYQVAYKAGLAFFARDSGQPFSDPQLDPSKDLFAIADKLHPFI
jgi:phosphoglycolate phosphatase-like HAD superfamily hydrolase